MAAFPLIAVDIGNARIKVGFFEKPGPADSPRALPLPRSVLPLSGRSPQLGRLGQWLDELENAAAKAGEPMGWWIGSVNRPAATRLVDWLRDNRPDDAVTLLSADDLPLEIGLDRPDLVGVDRLIDAVAANHIRPARRAAVVVDVGTAITVDLVSAQGVFKGGAILPGITMAAKAMHEFTDLLPMIKMSDLTSPPPAVGTSTEPAMRSGLFWGAVGSIRQLVERMTGELTTGDTPQETQVILTGGAGPAVAELLGHEALHVPQLTLSGIALTAWAQNS